MTSKFSLGQSILFIILFFAFASANAQPVKVSIVKNETGHTLLRGNKPYFIKGAGGTSYIERLAKYGGNSVRTWGSDKGNEVLDKAAKLGLTVTMGLDMTAERHGFNYDDTAAVKAQLERLRKEVRKYKDHSALLMWGIGNELNLEYKNEKVWKAVNDVAKMIHEEDLNHLATTMLAGVNPQVMPAVIANCTDIDLLAVQVYGGLASVPQELLQTGWNKPYIVTEWGPTGHWECLQTPWNASIEETSSQKAAVYKSRYEASIQKDKNCLGSYVFLWGQKQERTPTWYGLFTEAGEESEVIDVMQYLWNGKWPAVRAPHLESFTIDGKKAADFIYLEPGKKYTVKVNASDPNGAKLSNRWELLPESTDLKNGGDYESRPKAIAGAVSSKDQHTAIITAPEKPGAYRLFVYVNGKKNKVATANIPFFVK